MRNATRWSVPRVPLTLTEDTRYIHIDIHIVQELVCESAVKVFGGKVCALIEKFRVKLCFSVGKIHFLAICMLGSFDTKYNRQNFDRCFRLHDIIIPLLCGT